MKLDGTELVKDNGTVIFTEQTVRPLEDGLGISWTQMQLSQIAQMSDELIEASKALASWLDVVVPIICENIETFRNNNKKIFCMNVSPIYLSSYVGLKEHAKNWM